MLVHVAGAWRNPDNLREVDGETLGASVQHALAFIQNWNAGKQEFTFHTSGSTGEPKPITFSRDMLESSARLSIEALALKPGMNALVSLDTRFVAGAMMLVRGLIGNLNLILRNPSANPLKDVKEPVDFLAVVPLQLTTLLKESPADLDRTAIVIIGGASLSEETILELQAKQSRFMATYGMTETLTHIALRRLNGPHRQSCFYPLPGVRMSVDARGCLVIHATHLGSMPIVTNDLVALTLDGGFEVLGRADEVINSGGYKVHPNRVEPAVRAVLQSLGIPSRFFIAGIPDAALQEKVCLVMESQPLSDDLEDRLKSLMQEQLPRYEAPRTILYRSRFIETSTQKIDKRATLKI